MASSETLPSLPSGAACSSAISRRRHRRHGGRRRRKRRVGRRPAVGRVAGHPTSCACGARPVCCAAGRHHLPPTPLLLITTHYSLLTKAVLTTHYALLTPHYALLTTHYALLTRRAARVAVQDQLQPRPAAPRTLARDAPPLLRAPSPPPADLRLAGPLPTPPSPSRARRVHHTSQTASHGVLHLHLAWRLSHGALPGALHDTGAREPRYLPPLAAP